MCNQREKVGVTALVLLFFMFIGIQVYATEVASSVTPVAEETGKWDKAGKEVSEAAKAIREASGESYEEMKKKSAEAWSKTKEQSGELVDKSVDASEKAIDSASETSKEAWEKTKEESNELMDKAKSKVHEMTAPDPE